MSDVDVTIPADGEVVVKSEFRAQWIVIKAEIEALEGKSRLPEQLAYNVLSV
jgi:hypothetical protein